jgi:hypothetical protein
MINKAKLALIVAVAALFASPALARSFDGHRSIGREMRARHAGAHRTHRIGLNAYASEPRPQSDIDSNSPASTGGGSLGYVRSAAVHS